MEKYYIGLDGGSTYLKAAMIKDKRVIDTLVRNTGIDNNGTAERLVAELCERNRVKREQIGYIMATGYSRKVLEVADDDISEITAHAYGVRLTAPPEYRPGMIIDIGGQDSKIIYLDEHYKVKNFSMNDKCAAGTGKFMEVIACGDGKIHGSHRADPGDDDRSGRAALPGCVAAVRYQQHLRRFCSVRSHFPGCKKV